MSKTLVLVVDDDPDLSELIHEALISNFDVFICSDTQEASRFAESKQPPIIILDVNLPCGNSLEFCKELAAGAQYAPLVMFISGEHSLDLCLKTYNHGGSDFLAKPFRIQELQAKVEALNQFYQKNSQLKKTSEFATETAMNAMIEASQYGEILHFYNDMYNASDVDKIQSSFFKLMENFGLKCSVQFRVEKTHTFDFSGNGCSPIEVQLFDNLFESDRLITFSNRLMVNGRFVSFIVKNMPVTDDVKNGRLRDILATLIEGVDAKLLDIQRLDLLRQTSEELSQSSQRLTKLMKDHEDFISNAMNLVISELNASFDVLNLNEDQEKFFTSLTERILNSMEESFIRVGNETDVLSCIRLSLGLVLNNQRSL